MMRINFAVFDNNSSSRDEICAFGFGECTLDSAEANMWDPAAKAEVRKLRTLSVKMARARVRAWAKRRGIQ